MNKPVIVTGLRANNDLHIGNYFGAIMPLIRTADSSSSEYQINMFIPDLHSFTTPIEHEKLQQQIISNARLYVAAGLPLNNPSILLYRQSYISAHSELAWILDCFTGMGELERMTQFKDKSSRLSKERISVGLFNYPVLMASDILLHNAVYVPIGEDQTQHLEFTRNIAERINARFGEVFVVPETVENQHKFFTKGQALRIKDLIDPTKKMSKSEESNRGIIFLTDNPDVAASKIMSATTDDLASVNYDPNAQPGISNLLQILSLLRDRPLDSVEQEFKGESSYGNFKHVVAEEMKSFLVTFQEQLSKVKDENIIEAFTRSEVIANEQADAVLSKVHIALGLRPTV